MSLEQLQERHPDQDTGVLRDALRMAKQIRAYMGGEGSVFLVSVPSKNARLGFGAKVDVLA